MLLFVFLYMNAFFFYYFLSECYLALNSWDSPGGWLAAAIWLVTQRSSRQDKAYLPKLLIINSLNHLLSTGCSLFSGNDKLNIFSLGNPVETASYDNHSF